MSELIAWIIAFMVAVSPPTEQGHRDRGNETLQETTQRYEEIAEDLADVVYDSKNKPIFNEPDGRAHTAAVMLAIMFHESKFYRDVDHGDPTGIGDSGRSWCMMQIMAGKHPSKTLPWNFVQDRPPQYGDSPDEIEEGVTGQELADNRRLCFYEGLKMVRWSYSRCGSNPFDKLKVYASGSCDKGASASKRRVFTAERYWLKSKKRRTWVDAEIIDIFRRKKYNEELTAMLIQSELYHPSQPYQVFDFGWQRPEPTEYRVLW
jgi:hypothetical protein